MTDAEINYYANKIREAFCNRIPVDVYNICRSVSIQIHEEFISSEAYLICENGRMSIIVKKTADNKRKAFSVGHELGHFFLPHHSKLIFGCSYNDMTFKTSKPFEIEANKFASQLLMPTEYLRPDIRGDINIQLISDEARKFNVSFSSMAIRLAQLAYDTIAVFCIEDRLIKWSIKSKDFEFELNRGQISDKSVASELFKEKVYQIKKANVPADSWIEDTPFDYVYEESIYFPNYNSSIVIIHYNLEDVEDYSERR